MPIISSSCNKYLPCNKLTRTIAFIFLLLTIVWVADHVADFVISITFERKELMVKHEKYDIYRSGHENKSAVVGNFNLHIKGKCLFHIIIKYYDCQLRV